MMKTDKTMPEAAETETVFLPPMSGESDSVWVARNGHSWNIPRGTSVTVPVVVACILRECEARKREAKARAEKEAAKASHAMTADGASLSL